MSDLDHLSVHQLRTLRGHLDDPLLVGGTRGLVLTARGKALEGPLRRSLRELEALLGGAGAFDPAQTRRAFVLGMWDAPTVTVLPGLLARVCDEAPGIDLDISPVPTANVRSARTAPPVSSAPTTRKWATRSTSTPGCASRTASSRRTARASARWTASSASAASPAAPA